VTDIWKQLVFSQLSGYGLLWPLLPLFVCRIWTSIFISFDTKVKESFLFCYLITMIARMSVVLSRRLHRRLWLYNEKVRYENHKDTNQMNNNILRPRELFWI
jgi:hypothetical protein